VLREKVAPAYGIWARVTNARMGGDMALLIEDPEVERLAAELAETTGETVDVPSGRR
jgi:hypothetical protein